jgi:DNA mismatch repair protein MutL
MQTAAPHASPRIRLLPTGLVNRIAAGEVIERPAAAVKELVENALDAGARRVAVSLLGGGIDRIEVVDDGCGMDAGDLLLAVQRHCTSKLLDETLVRITTLGFRGEALPSIGAAARLHVTSRPHGAPHAHLIRVEGGVLAGPEPTPGAPGTRVVVADLFYATPARRKFLKHPRTEGEHAEQAVRRLALAAPGVAFRCEVDGRAAFDLPAQDRAARVAALLGPEAAAALLPVEEARGGMRLSGFACAPSVSRATGVAQGLVVNGRPVADPVLKVALRVAYRDVIANGRHPVAALYLDLPADELDVNVHPAKTELRFHDPAGVRSLVIGALSRVLAGGASVGPDGGPRPPLRLVSSQLQGRPGRGGPRYQGFAEAQLPLGAAPAARALPAPALPAVGAPELGLQPAHPLGAAVAQVLDTYILAVAADGGLVLVDQHAAHERLTHEALRAQHLAGEVRCQPLLLPAVVDLPPADAARLLDQADALARLGLELEGFGPGAVLVRSLPAALGSPDPALLLRDLADELAEAGEATALDARIDAVLARLACHGSLRAGRRLLQPEMDALLRQMEATPRAATCSHGRPTFLKLSRAEIERMFGRR